MRHVPRGTFDTRVLDQEHYWVTADGAVLQLTAMSTAHLTNVLAMLEQQAVRLHLEAIVGALVDLAAARARGGTTAEEITYKLTGSSLADITATAFFEAMPLVRAIRRELRTR